MKFEFVKIGLEHLDGILRVQERAYSSRFHEKAETFVSKIKFSPETCYGVLDGNRLIAYGISFPWLKNESVNLNSSLSQAPQNPEVMHVHDISVDPDYRGLGLAESLFLRIAHDAFVIGLNALTLVAVQGSSTYWSRFGFIESHSNVDDYGTEAVKMVLALESKHKMYTFKPVNLADLDSFHEFMLSGKPFIGSEFEVVTREELKMNLQSPFWFHGEMKNQLGELIGAVSLQKLEKGFSKIESLYCSETSISNELLQEFWNWLEIPIRIFASKTIGANDFHGFEPLPWSGYSEWSRLKGSEERTSHKVDGD
jgi:GNAT superfamily N-acetyltransferase